MTPLEQLLNEAIPTGQFGGPKPAPPTWTAAQQAEHAAVLDAETTAYDLAHRGDQRHLHALPDAA